MSHSSPFPGNAVSWTEDVKIREFARVMRLSHRVARKVLSDYAYNLNEATQYRRKNRSYYAESWFLSAASPSEEDAVRFFLAYADASEDVIGVEGVERLCQDAGVPPESPAWLAFAWHCGEAAMGEFSRATFARGCAEVSVASPRQLATFLQALQEAMDQEDVFLAVYRYTFGYAAGGRHLPLELAVPLWELLLPGFPRFERFAEFVNAQGKPITRDTWLMVREFAMRVSADLSNYDPNEAWPLLLDAYVEHCREGGAA